MRILHTMLRIVDMQRSIDFYTRVMGMKLLRRVDRPQDGYALAFVGYGDEATDAVLELTHNYSKNQYDMGTAYGHIAIEVRGAAAACEKIASLGGKVVRKAGPVMGGTTVIAFVEDPDGYRIELIENPHAKD